MNLKSKTDLVSLTVSLSCHDINYKLEVFSFHLLTVSSLSLFFFHSLFRCFSLSRCSLSLELVFVSLMCLFLKFWFACVHLRAIDSLRFTLDLLNYVFDNVFLKFWFVCVHLCVCVMCLARTILPSLRVCYWECWLVCLLMCLRTNS